jgi:hypothetical protein
VRLGCVGCLATILGLLVIVGGAVWGTALVLQDPYVQAVPSSPEDAARAQQKVFRLLTGSAREPVVLSEVEVNALLLHIVDPRDLPVDRPTVLLRADDVVELVGRVPVRRLIEESPLAPLSSVLPRTWLTRSLWMHLAAHGEFHRDPRAQLRFAVLRVTLGRQRVPTLALRLLFEPASLRFARVSLPDSVADVRIEAGRIVIRPTSSRGRT